ncbi:MAG: DNA damage-inducible protein D, partial [Proteobacteria bacterium]|nr:DNA damage-inducible protein D [Pseudomonadota bacterium]
MTDTALQALKQHFNQLAQCIGEDSIEFWFARDLMVPLGYSRWENFMT